MTDSSISGFDHGCVVGAESQETDVEVSRRLYGAFLFNFGTNFTSYGLGFLWV